MRRRRLSTVSQPSSALSTLPLPAMYERPLRSIPQPALLLAMPSLAALAHSSFNYPISQCSSTVADQVHPPLAFVQLARAPL